MRSIGSIDPQRGGGGRKHVDAKNLDKQRAAYFAQVKTDWALQVAADKALSPTAWRVALAIPFWLNSKTLLLWPAQSTIAETINCHERSVRDALKKLEDRGHLFCTSEYRGGRNTNRYRIVLQDVILCDVGSDTINAETGTLVPATPERTGQSGGQVATAHHGTDDPVSAVLAGRGTPERTLERTNGGGDVPSPRDLQEEQPQLRASKEAALEIMRQAYGTGNVNEHGHLLRK